MFIPTHFTHFDCVICLDSIECFKTPTERIVFPKRPKYDQNVFISSCKHVYHHDCIKKWLNKGSNQCPQCRHNITTRNTFKHVDNEDMGTESVQDEDTEYVQDEDTESVHDEGTESVQDEDTESVQDDMDFEQFIENYFEFLKYKSIISKYIFHDNAALLLFICNIFQNTLHSSISCFSTISKYMKEKIGSILVFYVIVSMH